MNTNEVTSDSPTRHWYQYLQLKHLIVVAILIILISSCVWIYRIQIEPFHLYSNITDMIHSLENKPPPTMMPQEWEVAVGWTGTAAGNCFMPGHFEINDLRNFERELKEKVKGKVDMDTLLWVWDQIAIISTIGKDYQKYKEEMFRDMHWKEIGEKEEKGGK